MKSIYLDYAAATPQAPEVTRAAAKYAAEFFNPAAVYLAGQAVADDIQVARRQTADLLGAKPAEIIFTSGATESNNLAIGGVLKSFPKSRVAAAATEHKSVIEPAKAHSGGRLDIIAVNSTGLVEPGALQRAIKPDTLLISIAYADSELGSIQSFRGLKPVIEAERHRRRQAGGQRPLYLHSDVSAAANYLGLHVDRLGVDLLSLGGGKIYGPKTAGALYVNQQAAIEPLIYGGGQERNLRSGTANAAGIVGFARALKLVQSERSAEAQRVGQLKHRLKQALLAIEGIGFNGQDSRQLPNFLSFTIPGADGERLVMKLDQLGLMVGTGAACNVNFDQPSSALKAIGLSDAQANATLRLSLGRPTTVKQVDQAAKLLVQTITG